MGESGFIGLKFISFNVTTPLKAWNARSRKVRPANAKSFNVTTPLKAWNARFDSPRSVNASRFNVTTPLKAWNGIIERLGADALRASM